MILAEIKDGSIVTYPYTTETLHEQNPNSMYDSRYTLQEWHAITERAQQGYSLVTVKILPLIFPTNYDQTLYKAVPFTVPSYSELNGWHMGWDYIPKTPEEITFASSETSIPS